MHWKALCFLLLMHFVLPSQAVVLNSDDKVFDLLDRQVFYKEPNGISLEDMLGKIASNQLDHLQSVKVVDYQSGAYWLINVVENKSANDEWVLFIGDPLINKVDLYLLKDQVLHLSANYSDMAGNDFLFPMGRALRFKLRQGEKRLIALRIEADIYDQTAVVQLMPKMHFENWAATSGIVYLLVLGGLLGLVMYSFLLAVITRDGSYGWFSMFAFSSSLLILAYYGYLYPLVGFDQVNRYFDMSIMTVSISSLFIFVYKLLALDQFRFFSWLFKIAGLLLGLNVAFSLLGDVVDFALAVDTAGSVLVVLAIISSATLAVARRMRQAWFLFVSGMPLATTWYAYSLIRHDALSEPVLVNNIALSSNIALFFMFFVMLLAIVDKIRVLEKGKKIAESSSHEKSHFIASASHDLRQPLHSLGLFLSLLEKHVHKEGKSFLVNVKSSLAAAQSLFSDILDISRLEAGVIAPKSASVDLGALLKQLYAEFYPQARAKNIDLRCRACHHWVYTDGLMLERILRNLISNAIHHTQNGGVLLACRLRGEQLWLECWDTGKGIENKKLTKIFNEFNQIEDAPDEILSNKRVGLGLSIVKKFTQLLNIQLHVFSRYGVGSLFRISLPLAEAARPSLTTIEKNSDCEAYTKLDCKVWVLDDDVLVLEGMKAILEGWGYEVVALRAQSQLLKMYEGAQTPNLLVVDFDIGDEKNGFDIITEFRHKFPEVPAVMITGNTGVGVINEATKNKIPLLYKPLNAAKLRYLLQRILTTSMN